jgi:ATP-dependent DNA helicase RecG
MGKNKESCAMKFQKLIKSGESETLEFKEKFDERTVESAVAFASTKCSLIFIKVHGAFNI